MSFIKGESLLDLVPNDVKPWCYGEWDKCLKSRYCVFDERCYKESKKEMNENGSNVPR